MFASTRYVVNYTHGFASPSGFVETPGPSPLATNWSFLSDLMALDTCMVHGEEIEFLKEAADLAVLLERAARGSKYSCAFKPQAHRKDDWLPLARSRYGDVGAGAFVYGEPKRHVIILPEMPNFVDVLVEFLERFCASWNPSLFPHLEGALGAPPGI